MSRSTKIVVDNLILDLKARPTDFICDGSMLKDKANGYYYWVANGVFHGGIHLPYEMYFGIFQSVRFHLALNKWKAWTNINTKII